MKNKIKIFVKIIQKIIITISLFVIYFIGLGITKIFIMIFNRKQLREGFEEKDSFWQEARGYEADINKSFRQS